jgi:hypothetical protein
VSGWLGGVIEAVRDAVCRIAVLRCHEEVAHEKRAAVDHAAEAAERVKRRMANPRIRLIVQSADDMRGAFEERRRQ